MELFPCKYTIQILNGNKIRLQENCEGDLPTNSEVNLKLFRPPRVAARLITKWKNLVRELLSLIKMERVNRLPMIRK